MALILLIENSPLMRPTLRDLLQLNGHTVITATQTEDALEMLPDIVGLDLVIADYVMPDLDGLTFVERMRSDSEYQGVPVLVFSVKAEAHIAERAQQVGVDICMIPPITVKDLMNTVHNMLSGNGHH